MSTPTTGPDEQPTPPGHDGASDNTEQLDVAASADGEPTTIIAAEETAAAAPAGEPASTDPTEEPTTVVPTAHGPLGAGPVSEEPTAATAPLPADIRYTPAEPVPGTYWQDSQGTDVPVEDPLQYHQGEPAVFPEGVFHEPPSRAGAHLWAVLIALTLSPVAWFLLNDGSARMYWSLRADPNDVNVAGLVGLGAGLLVSTVVLLTGRWSSVGAAVSGSIGFLAGLAFAILPAQTLEIVGRSEDFLDNFGAFGSNVYDYIVESGIRGYFLVAGFGLILLAVVSHGARRKGRREEFARLAVRAARGENPWG